MTSVEAREGIARIVSEEVARTLSGWSFSTLIDQSNLEARYKMLARAVAARIAALKPEGEIAGAIERCAAVADFEAALAQENLDEGYDVAFNKPRLRTAKRIAFGIRALSPSTPAEATLAWDIAADSEEFARRFGFETRPTAKVEPTNNVVAYADLPEEVLRQKSAKVEPGLLEAFVNDVADGLSWNSSPVQCLDRIDALVRNVREALAHRPSEVKA
jgi:hypothetical protein